MSHISIIGPEIQDLTALKSAAAELGAQWMEGQESYRWYGKFQGDSPLPAGMTKEELGKCTHAIKVPGINYEIGVVKNANGKYTLAYDFWGAPEYMNHMHDGDKLLQKFGPNCQRLAQSYSKHATLNALRKRGYHVQQVGTGKNGEIKLQVVGI